MANEKTPISITIPVSRLGPVVVVANRDIQVLLKDLPAFADALHTLSEEVETILSGVKP